MESPNISRRSFMKAAGGLGVLSIAGVGLSLQSGKALADDAVFPERMPGNPIEARVDPKTGEVEVNKDVVVRYSACLGCYASCGNRLKLSRDGERLYTVGGNPYHPSGSYPYLNHDVPLEDAYRTMSFANGTGNQLRGTVCGRGLGTWDSYSQADRVTVPLKRAGKRGEGKWKPIGWDQLISEVVEGGKLFADIGEEQEIEGFRALYDNETPIDPKQPDLGPLSNQLVQLGGRSDGRSYVSIRFTNIFGSVNSYSHGSTCGGTFAASTYTEGGMGWTSADLDNAEYVLFAGHFPGGNGWSFQGIPKRVSDRLQRGEMTADVVDPTLANGCVTPTMQGINWVPIKPTTNTALALALLQSLMDNKLLNEEFLSYPSNDAAVAGGFAAYTNGSFLVVNDESDPRNGMFLRVADAGLEEPSWAAEVAATYEEMGMPAPEYYAVIDKATGQPVANADCASADIEFEGDVAGIKVRSAYRYLKDSVYERTMDEYAEITGVPVDEIERIAKELAAHAPKVAVMAIGSTVMSNGIDVAMSMRVLNAVLGAQQMVGGCNATGGSYTSDGDGPRYLFSSSFDYMAPESNAMATPISRNGKDFTETDEYKNRVAAGEKDPQPLLPWFPLAPAADNQAVFSIANQYPYQAKIILSWMVNNILSTPGAMQDAVLDKFKDPAVVPLHIASDVIIGENAQLADYIVPDTIPYESFGTPGDGGTWSGHGSAARWQAKTPETMKLDDGRFASFEAFCIDVAKELGMPGYGDDAIMDVDGKLWPHNDAYDYWLKAIANIACAEPPVPDITEEEMNLQALDKLPEAWKSAVTADEWPKVLNVLSRGGRFDPIEVIEGEDGRSAFAVEFQSFLYSEARATSSNFYSGKAYSPVMHVTPQTFIDGTPYEDRYSRKEYPFMVASHKPRFRSSTMLANSPVMQDICEHNYLEINDEDAKELGIKDGEQIKVSGPSGPAMEGEAMVRKGIMRGSIGLAFGYGHNAYGSQDVAIDGQETRKGNPVAGAGVALQIMDDPTVKDVVFPVADLEWASPGRNGGMYKIEKA